MILRIDGWSDGPNKRLITYQILDDLGASVSIGTVEVKLDATPLSIRRACLKDAKEKHEDVELSPESEFASS